jgi:hypothetical protein
LCFSPVGDKFSKRARDFPGLINGCTIDWFLPWPQDALVAVSTKFIGDFEMACDESVKRKLQAHMGGVHVAVTKGTYYISASSPGTEVYTTRNLARFGFWRIKSTAGSANCSTRRRT